MVSNGDVGKQAADLPAYPLMMGDVRMPGQVILPGVVPIGARTRQYNHPAFPAEPTETNLDEGTDWA